MRKLLCTVSIFCALTMLAGRDVKRNNLVSAPHSEWLKDGFQCGRIAGIWLVFDAKHNTQGMDFAKEIFINGGCAVLMKDSGVHDDLLKSVEKP